jgi:hypothetical protein
MLKGVTPQYECLGRLQRHERILPDVHFFGPLFHVKGRPVAVADTADFTAVGPFMIVGTHIRGVDGNFVLNEEKDSASTRAF